MTTHVFIVNEDTFPIHLRYMFAGTGKGKEGEENIGMISDLSGCRMGDKVIFYVEGVGFFGVFKVDSAPFWEKTGEYLTKDIKKLTNRVLVKPHKIYSLGVPEWEALDNLDNLPNGRDSPANNLIWSLIYRKLEAGRGCTPIFNYEYEQLISLIDKINSGTLKNVLNYKYNPINKSIEELNDPLSVYDIQQIKEGGIPLIDELNHNQLGVEEKIVLVKKRQFKYEGMYKGRKITKIQRKCEEELEYFFVKNIGFDASLDKIMGKKEDLIFWGRQIFCGVGKRRIDVLAIMRDNTIKLIELKDDNYYSEHLEQLTKYVRWAEQYVRDPKKKKIQPILVLNSTESINKEEIAKFNKKIVNYSGTKLLIYIWKIKENRIDFEEFNYNE